MTSWSNSICVVCGGGNLPLRVISKLGELHRQFFAISIKGFGSPEYPQFGVGQIGAMLEFIKAKGATGVVFCGSVKRPGMFSLKLDNVGRKWLHKLGMRAFLGDNALLKGIKELLRAEGLNVISPQGILGTLLTPAGVLTTARPSEIDLRDIARGVFVLNTLSRADVGQAVVVQEGVVLGIEAAEGTKRLIERCADLKVSDARGGVLVKTAKLKQELSIDLPTIGKHTVLEAEHSGLSGIAIGAGASQIIDCDETTALANEKGLFIIGIE